MNIVINGICYFKLYSKYKSGGGRTRREHSGVVIGIVQKSELLAIHEKWPRIFN